MENEAKSFAKTFASREETKRLSFHLCCLQVKKQIDGVLAITFSQRNSMVSDKKGINFLDEKKSGSYYKTIY